MKTDTHTGKEIIILMQGDREKQRSEPENKVTTH